MAFHYCCVDEAIQSVMGSYAKNRIMTWTRLPFGQKIVSRASVGEYGGFRFS
jgi:hypothetical protein